MKLYEISSKYEQILDKISRLDENVDQEEIESLKKELESLDDDGEDKAIAIASHIENTRSDIHEIDEAILRMKERKERLENEVMWKEAYLKFHLNKIGKTKITKCPYFVINLKSCPDSVDVLDISQVPKEYFRSKIMESLDRVKAKKEMKEGVIIPGLTLKNEIKLDIR